RSRTTNSTIFASSVKRCHFVSLSILSCPIRQNTAASLLQRRISSTVSIVYEGGGRRSSHLFTANLGSPSIAARNIANRTSPLARGAVFFRGETAAGTKI